MTTFSQLYARLRRKDWRQYALLAGCCFFSVLLLTAYVCMMRSPTILSVLPEGGDSRKQVIMIFAMTVIGCGVFTLYASGLFFRQKSRQLGLFLALGATRRQVAGALTRELALLALVPIWLYNGEKGPGGRWAQYAAYAFYPLHQLVLYLLFALLR